MSEVIKQDLRDRIAAINLRGAMHELAIYEPNAAIYAISVVDAMDETQCAALEAASTTFEADIVTADSAKATAKATAITALEAVTGMTIADICLALCEDLS